MGVHIVYVVVFVSLGWFFFFGFCLLALWYLLTCRQKKKEKKLQETEVIRRAEHLKVKEDFVKGPKGAEAVALSIEKDETFEEDIIKNDKEKEKEVRGKNTHWKNNGADIEEGASASN
ncbi:hypothetical protein C2S53_012409 [Perilla frutescens var. hirtella]|uniref:Uncharacterized protein n=1 Tax=Perilla frutescens var. hirtella TaxID=608512 RepID=A0AAD4JLL7_PERFH|nr:hypothetical protein C2S53_012409 [Perilla frutescens var. hirtella]